MNESELENEGVILNVALSEGDWVDEGRALPVVVTVCVHVAVGVQLLEIEAESEIVVVSQEPSRIHTATKIMKNADLVHDRKGIMRTFECTVT